MNQTSAEDLQKLWRNEKGNSLAYFKAILDSFDIYPKGTVARLMGEVEELKDYTFQSETRLTEINKELQAEIDRLKVESLKNEKLEGFYYEKSENLQAEFDRLKGQQKPEAVGCGNFQAGKDALHSCGGPSGFICPDCQAKALEKAAESAAELYLPGGPLARLDPPNNLNGQDKESTLSQKVVLPEVPNIHYQDSRQLKEVVESILKAVKECLEGKGAKMFEVEKS